MKDFRVFFAEASITQKIYFVTLVLIFIVTAWHSHGFYHADEHYQLLEYARYKLGLNSPDELAWEFSREMRASFQVGIAYLGFSTCKTFGIHNVYLQLFLFRLLTLLLYTIAIVRLNNCLAKHYSLEKRSRINLLLLSLSLWFIPTLSIRFSSETWSGIFLAFALSEVYTFHRSKKHGFFIGVLLGVSFLCRYQIAFAILPILVFLFLDKSNTLRNQLIVLGSFFSVIVLGFILDYWFYGKFTIIAWNYFYINLIEGAASQFGESSAVFYLKVILNEATTLVGVPFLLAVLILIFLDIKNLLLCSFLIFILGHSLIGHKETRFIFPILFCIGPIIYFGFRSLRLRFPNIFAGHFPKVFLFWIFITINTVGSILIAFKSAGIGRMEITKYLEAKAENNKIRLHCLPWSNPYNPWMSVPMKLYQQKNITELDLKDISFITESERLMKNDFLIVRRRDLNNEKRKSLIESGHLLLKKISIPEYLFVFEDYYPSFNWNDVLYLYEYVP